MSGIVRDLCEYTKMNSVVEFTREQLVSPAAITSNAIRQYIAMQRVFRVPLYQLMSVIAAIQQLSHGHPPIALNAGTVLEIGVLDLGVAKFFTLETDAYGCTVKPTVDELSPLREYVEAM